MHSMKTLIFDIDGTLTTMWPIEKLMLLTILGKELESEIEKLYQSGVRDTYTIFSQISQNNIGKIHYRKIYNRAFNLLERKKRLPKTTAYPVVTWIQENKTL